MGASATRRQPRQYGQSLCQTRVPSIGCITEILEEADSMRMILALGVACLLADAIKFPRISAPTEAGRRKSPGSFSIAKRSGQCCGI